jgi:chromosome segregation ATPase
MRKVALLFALATAAAAALAWWETQELAETRTELAAAGGHLQKARADLQGAQTELAALRKEAAAGKFTLQQMQADLTTARNFLEAERAANTRLRDDMAKTKELLAAAMSRRPAAPAAQPQSAQPMAVSPRPTAARAARSGPTSVGAASPAR